MLTLPPPGAAPLCLPCWLSPSAALPPSISWPPVQQTYPVRSPSLSRLTQCVGAAAEMHVLWCCSSSSSSSSGFIYLHWPTIVQTCLSHRLCGSAGVLSLPADYGSAAKDKKYQTRIVFGWTHSSHRGQANWQINAPTGRTVRLRQDTDPQHTCPEGPLHTRMGAIGWTKQSCSWC